MRHALLNDHNNCYWGDLEGDLKGKKLSIWSSIEQNEESFDCAVIKSDGFALDLQIPNVVEIRANFGKHGPEIELVE